MISTRDIQLADRRKVRAHFTEGSGDVAPDAFTVMWHHGSPQTGALLEPLLAAAASRGIRLVSCGRPSYGGSSPHRGRNVASVAFDLAEVVDALNIDRFAVMGASGGGPHALACAALLPDRVSAVACFASIAQRTTEFDWLAGMADDGGLRAAMSGRAARASYQETSEFEPSSFNELDYATLDSEWVALGADVGVASGDGPDGLIDDDCAFVAEWGFRVEDIVAPVLVVQGGDDRVVPASHGEWLRRSCRNAELWLYPEAGHISILRHCADAMDWLRDRSA